jgi:hypothetical protein
MYMYMSCMYSIFNKKEIDFIYESKQISKEIKCCLRKKVLIINDKELYYLLLHTHIYPYTYLYIKKKPYFLVMHTYTLSPLPLT